MRRLVIVMIILVVGLWIYGKLETAKASANQGQSAKAAASLLLNAGNGEVLHEENADVPL
ncbi:hypothetical protein AB6A23_12045 [Paenibacillus tarimensis]